MGVLYRIEGWLREILYRLKPTVRAARLQASLLRFRLRRWLGDGEEVRVVCEPARESRPPLAHPALSVASPEAAGHTPEEDGQRQVTDFLARQTENSVSRGPGGEYLFLPAGDLGALAPTHLESMLMVAAAGDWDVVLSGAAPPFRDRESAVVLARRGAEMAAKLVRLPRPAGRSRPVLGRVAPQIGDPLGAGRLAVPEVPSSTAGRDEDREPTLAPVKPGLRSSGPWLLAFDARGRGIRHQPLYEVDAALSALPPAPEAPTVLFLLPYLAVGGAERLLFDLLAGLDGLRALVVTLEPHRPALGQTVSRARELTPHVYTLGDWLPREAHGGVLRHLVRRYGVGTLMSWNATTWFYDEAPALKRTFPDLRLVNQLYNHRGGWIAHYRPALVHAVDCHVAVNRRIAHALEERGVPRGRIRLLYHGVQVPGLPSETERRRRRDERRRELGLPLDATVVGTFVRMHRQKRPQDVVRLARRFRDRRVFFLLVGGGPMDGRLEREIAADPPPNLVRLPLTPNTEPLFDALDLCLLTSAYEGLPVFLLEGLARGIPCVSTAAGDVPVLLAGGGGRVVRRTGDLEELEVAIETLLGDQERRREGELGRGAVERRFSLAHYRAAYRSVLETSARE